MAVVTIDVTYEGSLRCRAVHRPSGTELLTDAPVDNQGRGARFSPTDLVATALGTCILTTMGIVAQRHGIALDGATVRVEKHMIGGLERRIGALPVTIRVPGVADERVRKLLQNAARGCPVLRSLDAAVETSVTFSWE